MLIHEVLQNKVWARRKRLLEAFYEEYPDGDATEAECLPYLWALDKLETPKPPLENIAREHRKYCEEMEEGI